MALMLLPVIVYAQTLVEEVENLTHFWPIFLGIIAAASGVGSLLMQVKRHTASINELWETDTQRKRELMELTKELVAHHANSEIHIPRPHVITVDACHENHRVLLATVGSEMGKSIEELKVWMLQNFEPKK
jgi:hypothetical protein